MSALWDATPGVCCAAFQLGACAHTEAYEPEEDDAEAIARTAALVAELEPEEPDTCPF